MRVKLLNNGGKQWKQFDNNYIKGFAFIKDQLLDEKEIADYLLNAIKNKTVKDAVLLLNGSFSAIIKEQDTIYLFADKLKTYPLLYTFVNHDCLITDQAKVIIESGKKHSLDDIAVASYLATGYLYYNKTFLKDCFLVSAGTFVIITGDKAIVHGYHTHIYEKTNMSDEYIMEGCVESMENSFKRLIKSIGNRPIWIPLSGGYDSRLLICLCKKFNVQNVKCFTYGIPDSNEIKVSRQVANKLGFPWHCVTYSKEKFLTLANTQHDDDYILWGMNLNSTSHFQDFIAIKELREQGIMEPDAVIVPGHSGEILGRDQVPYNLLGSKLSVAELVYYKYFQWNTVKKSYKNDLLKELGQELNSTIASNNKALTIDMFTNWNIQNRQSNFIVNSVRVYEYFDLEWRVPLWDDELSCFWYSLDYSKNSNVALYNKFLFQKYFIPMGVDFYKPSSKSQQIVAKVRLPFGIKDFVKGLLSKLTYFKIIYDENNLNSKTNFYLRKITRKLPSSIILKESNANAVLAMYQIDLLSKLISE